jgi:4-oxalomesaconate tautomerase
VFEDTAGSTCGALLPTGNPVDEIEGIAVTLIDNGMPCVVMRASDLGISGDEAPKDLEADSDLRARLEAIRLAAGPLMNLGDVTRKSVPKMTMVAAARHGAIATRTFIPHRCHASIGVLGAVSVATACLLPAGPAAELARIPPGTEKTLSIEHPSGEMSVMASMSCDEVKSVAVLRTARKLFDGIVFG